MTIGATAVGLAVGLAIGAAPVQSKTSDPLEFFAGQTESLGTVKVAMKKPFRSRTIGKGRIMPDGSLNLVQRVEDEGKRPKERRWHIHRVAPGRFTGTMTEAKGPVTVQQFGGRYRFRFHMDGNVAIEQWLTPTPDGRSARSVVVIRKYGVRVGGSEAVIHKLD